jgi:hypothetical protein
MNPKTAMATGKSKEFGYIAAILDKVVNGLAAKNMTCAVYRIFKNIVYCLLCCLLKQW